MFSIEYVQEIISEFSFNFLDNFWITHFIQLDALLQKAV